MPIAGELVTETFDYDAGRQVTVYVPPDPPAAIVFAGDGQMIAQWDGSLAAADVPPTMIVGVHRVADETLGTTVSCGKQSFRLWLRRHLANARHRAVRMCRR